MGEEIAMPDILPMEDVASSPAEPSNGTAQDGRPGDPEDSGSTEQQELDMISEGCPNVFPY